MGRKKVRPKGAPTVFSVEDPKRKKAHDGARGQEVVLKLIDGSSHSVFIGEYLPTRCAISGRSVMARVVRVDEDIDAVYGVDVAELPMPWWKANRAVKTGEMTNEEIESMLKG